MAASQQSSLLSLLSSLLHRNFFFNFYMRVASCIERPSCVRAPARAESLESAALLSNGDERGSDFSDPRPLARARVGWASPRRYPPRGEARFTSELLR